MEAENDDLRGRAASLGTHINDLEAELRSSFTLVDKPPSPERARARAAVRGGARQAARAR